MICAAETKIGTGVETEIEEETETGIEIGTEIGIDAIAAVIDGRGVVPEVEASMTTGEIQIASFATYHVLAYASVSD